jgi:rhamnosyltransferase
MRPRDLAWAHWKYCWAVLISMRILAHIHTFNDADIIDRTIAAVSRQTRPVDEILLVDNASTDDTLVSPSLVDVTVIRHETNLGTSGTVHSGFRYALDKGYDWIWVFDADSIPEPDALEKLLDLYANFPPDRKEEIGFLASLPRNQKDDEPFHGATFTKDGLAVARPQSGREYYACNVCIWSGALYRLNAVRRVGLPNLNYVLDWGEFEYGNRMMEAGYTGIIHQASVLHHNIRGAPSLDPVDIKLWFAVATVYEFPPIRCYYMSRNMLYFLLYDVSRGRLGLGRRVVWTVFKLTANFVLRPRRHRAEILACFRGIWHGVTGNIAARY